LGGHPKRSRSTLGHTQPPASLRATVTSGRLPSNVVLLLLAVMLSLASCQTLEPQPPQASSPSSSVSSLPQQAQQPFPVRRAVDKVLPPFRGDLTHIPSVAATISQISTRQSSRELLSSVTAAATIKGSLGKVLFFSSSLVLPHFACGKVLTYFTHSSCSLG
jgi:hypothetical protein